MCDEKNENTNETEIKEPAIEIADEAVSDEASKIGEISEQTEESVTASEEPEQSEEISECDTESEAAESAETPDEVKPEKKPSKIQSAFDYLEILVFAACFVLMIFSAVFRLCSVDGSSMSKTLEGGEMLVISDFMYTPENGDIVVFHQTDDNDHYNKPIVKRVIATEGQWVYIEYGNDYSMSVYVSDDENIEENELLDEPYANLYPGPGVYENRFKAQVPEGCVFVLGDNRYNSADSRTSQIGFVDCRRILGKVLLRVTPLSKFGAVD